MNTYIIWRYKLILYTCINIFHYSQTAKDRFTDEEKRALDRANTYIYQEIRQAAEAHRQVFNIYLSILRYHC